MVRSTELLTKKGLFQLLEALPEIKPRVGYQERLDPEKVARFFLATGVRPTDLADPLSVTS